MKEIIEVFALMIKATPAEIVRALELKSSYKKIVVPKKNGGKRVLFIPPIELKIIQKKVLKWLRRFGDWDYYHGVYGLDFGSPVNHLSLHLSHRWFFCFDLKDAFYSSNVDRIKKIITSKLEEKRKFIIEMSAKLRQLSLWDILETEIDTDDWNIEELTDLIMSIATYDGLLPQGAPTSPFLFKLSITETSDQCPETRCGLYGLISLAAFPWEVSCYVDNFIISGSKPVPSDIKEKVFEEIKKAGFAIHKICSRDLRHGSPTICGLRINNNGGKRGRTIVLPKKTIRKWRGIIGKTRFDCSLELKKKVNGFLASLKPVYGNRIPPQINKLNGVRHCPY